jgi:hypothetical protein
VKRLPRLLLLAVALLSAGCPAVKGPSEERRDKAFAQASDTYRKLVRWGYFEEASQYLKGRDAPLEKPDFRAYDRYKITSYGFGEQVVSNTGDEARITAHIQYYDTETMKAGALRDEQFWWYDREAARWYLGSPMPVIDSAPRVREISR